MKRHIALTILKSVPVTRSVRIALAATLIALFPSYIVPTGLQAGASDLDSVPAALGSKIVTGSVAVGQAPSISLEPASKTVTPGSPFDLTVTINPTQSSDTIVTLTSSNSKVALVGFPSRTITAGTTTADSGVVAGFVGTATITATLPASLGGGSATATVKVVLPTLTVIPAFQEVVSSTGLPFALLTVTTNPAPTVDTGVDLTSSNPSAVTVPNGMLIPAGKTTICVPLRLLTDGSATITVTLATTSGGITKQANVFVTSASDSPTISLSPMTQTIGVGAQGTLTVRIDKAQGTSTAVILASCDPSVASVPASVVIPAGATKATFQVKGVAIRTVVITATTLSQRPGTARGGRTATATVVVR